MSTLPNWSQHPKKNQAGRGLLIRADTIAAQLFAPARPQHSATLRPERNLTAIFLNGSHETFAASLNHWMT
ncbi:MAG: hypothetical protein DMG30_23805 [Acidobacteria bacterium]|nr:MAG: hypothetical protein DMG30_23805 [Acidobacteriota bacterium]